MDTTFAVTLGFLAAMFLGSFVVLVLLCRYKSLRKRTAVYVKRLARSELSRSDIELIDKDEDKRAKRKRSSYDRWEDVDGRQSKDDLLIVKCAALLKLCDDVDLQELGPTDLNKIRYIVEIAHSISEETNNNESEKFDLIENRTAAMLASVSKALLKMDKQLMNLKETSLKEVDFLSRSNCII